MELTKNIEEEQKQLKEIFKDMMKYCPSKICGMLGNAIVVPIYTSLLHPEQYGLYSLSIAFLSFLCIIFSDWVGLSGLRFFRQHQLSQDLPKYLSVLVSILGINLFTMFVVSFFFRHSFYSFFNIDSRYLLAILILIIPVAIRALLFQLLRAQLKPIEFTISTILNQILTIGLSIFFIKVFHLGALAMLLGMGISITITDLILIKQSNILAYFIKPKLHWNVLIPIFAYGVPIAATSMANWIINQSNKFIMNNINGFKDVAYVGVAYGVTLPLLMTIFSIITVAAIPRIIRMYEEKYDVRPIISKFTGYYILISLPVIVIMIMFAYDFVDMLANPKFINAYKIVPYFALGTFFIGLADYTTLQYHLANKTYIELIIKTFSGILGIALNIILIPKMGLEGVGVATLTANFSYFLLSATIVLPNLGLIYPFKIIRGMVIGFLPTYTIYLYINQIVYIPSIIKMIILLTCFYTVYYLQCRVFRKYLKN